MVATQSPSFCAEHEEVAQGTALCACEDVPRSFVEKAAGIRNGGGDAKEVR
jgi:hypothetical protein